MICQIISNLNVNKDSKDIIYTSKPNKYFWLATRNLKNVEVTTAKCFKY